MGKNIAFIFTARFACLHSALLSYLYQTLTEHVLCFCHLFSSLCILHRWRKEETPCGFVDTIECLLSLLHGLWLSQMHKYIHSLSLHAYLHDKLHCETVWHHFAKCDFIGLPDTRIWPYINPLAQACGVGILPPDTHDCVLSRETDYFQAFSLEWDWFKWWMTTCFPHFMGRVVGQWQSFSHRLNPMHLQVGLRESPAWKFGGFLLKKVGREHRLSGTEKGKEILESQWV